MILLNTGILLLLGAGTWWLTGIDKTAGGESKRDRRLTRPLRCVAVVSLSVILLRLLEDPLDYGDIPILIIVPLCIALVLRSSLAELFTHGFLGLLDPAFHDHRELGVDLKLNAAQVCDGKAPEGWAHSKTLARSTVAIVCAKRSPCAVPWPNWARTASSGCLTPRFMTIANLE